MGLSLKGAGFSLVVVSKLLSSCGAQTPEHVGSVVAAHRLSSCGVGSIAAAHGLSCPTACGIPVPRPGLNPRPPHWKADSQPLEHRGSPPCYFNYCCF